MRKRYAKSSKWFHVREGETRVMKEFFDYDDSDMDPGEIHFISMWSNDDEAD